MVYICPVVKGGAKYPACLDLHALYVLARLICLALYGGGGGIRTEGEVFLGVLMVSGEGRRAFAVTLTVTLRYEDILGTY